MNIIEQLRRSWAITKKDLSVFYLKGPVVISGLLIPSFLFIAFVFGRKFSLEFLIPGLLGMALFVTVSSIGPVIAPWETRMRTFERLVSAPIALWAIILGDIMASLLFGLFITLFIVCVSVILLGTGILSLTLIVGTILAAFCFSSLGLVISAPPTDNPSNIMMLSSLIKFPLIFISGVFVPISEMGQWKIISFISPLTYYTDLARYSVEGSNYFSPNVDLLVLFGFSILFFVIAVKGHKKSLSKRF
ncbi:ABC transporter permease [candidate division WOR-3 bacterium]|nr:ABC transporter permease [candidate division WOR-3 bacterium]